MKVGLFLSAMGAAYALASSSQAQTTGITGGSAPVENRQPSLVLNRFVTPVGVFPARDLPDAIAGNVLGMVHTFAGDYAPFGNPLAQGQLRSIASNTALFSLYGTTYGGDGRTTFALPDLQGRTVIGQGQGPGLSPYSLGQAGGAAQNVMSLSQLATHDHDLPGGGVTGAAGGGQPLDNLQPYLAMNYQIAVNGFFPSGGAGDTFIGSVSLFGGGFATPGYLPADGRLLPILENETLFSLIGTTYGGDGMDTFALPDLRGRAIVGASSGASLGQSFGGEQVFLSESNLPAHAHTLPGGGLADSAGLGLPFNNTQPSLGLNYLIAITGLFPGQSGNGGVPDYAGSQFLGEVIVSAHDQVPNGWARAEGQLLPINQNQALFSILGTTFGGNGQTTFALPDLRGRTILGSGAGFTVGQVLGEDAHALTIAEMAVHAHALPAVTPPAIPEPSTWLLAIGGFGLVGAMLRRRRFAAT